jgi:hypothetical protein
MRSYDTTNEDTEDLACVTANYIVCEFTTAQQLIVVMVCKSIYIFKTCV